MMVDGTMMEDEPNPVLQEEDLTNLIYNGNLMDSTVEETDESFLKLGNEQMWEFSEFRVMYHIFNANLDKFSDFQNCLRLGSDYKTLDFLNRTLLIYSNL